MIPHSSPWITSDDINSVHKVILSRMIAQGEKTNFFEKKIAEYTKQKYALSTSSGQSAITLALRILKVGAGDDVMLPTYVCRSVLDAITILGANPVFCDIGENWCMTEKTVESALTPSTRAIIAVHMYGIPCDVLSISKFGIPIIEDSCQFLCPEAGKFGDLSVLSFHATKCIATGNGGMLLSREIPIQSVENYADRLSDFQSALGLSQLERYGEMLKRRQKIANIYNDTIPQKYLPNIKKSMYFRFPVLTQQSFEEISSKFLKHEIVVRRGVDSLLHRIVDMDDSQFPISVNKFNKTVSIPIYPALDEKQINKISIASAEILV